MNIYNAKCYVKIISKVEIFWDPPKGDFTKYYLYIDRLSDKDVPRYRFH